VVAVLVPGLPMDFVAIARRGLWWSAAAIPAALLAALWVTRLQHERDFVGMYAANLVVNGVLVLCLWLLARQGAGADLALAVGGALVVAMVLRLVWLRWRLRSSLHARPIEVARTDKLNDAPSKPTAMPSATVWLWAALSSGLPLALPFAARSLASASGEGALATFNYAWKLVELPLVLAIQLTASLAFPVITRAFASGADPAPAVRRAFSLGWTLACAAVAALMVGAPAIASLLFGRGRMDARGLPQIALWAQAGAWSLLPQAVIAVVLTVLATQGRLGAVAITYALGLGLLLLAGTQGDADGLRLMLLLNAVLSAVAVATLVLLGRAARSWLPWRLMGLTSAALALVALACVVGNGLISGLNMPLALGLSMLTAILFIAIGWLLDADMRAALRR
jgi:peptidoglycan biosynthesis protein MviN/MurJ (putative lipid II flippase)